MSLQLHVQVQMPNAFAFLAWLEYHLEAEGVQVQHHAQHVTLHMPNVGTLVLKQRSDQGFVCDVAAADARMAQLIQLSLEEHAQEFLAEQGSPVSALQFEWIGLPRADQQHRFQVVKVLAVEDITPKLRRVRLAVPVMAPFNSGGLHVRLLLPTISTPVQWPTVDADGRLQWAPEQQPLPQRIYTISGRDSQAQWIDIDIVRHTHTGPGSQWVSQVQAGAYVGLLGPAGGACPQAPHLLLVADMAGWPAALQIAAQQTRRGGSWQLLAVSTDSADLAYLPNAPQVHTYVGDEGSHCAAVEHWLNTQASDTPDGHLWLAAGQRLVQATRRALQAKPVSGLAQYKLAAYWK